MRLISSSALIPNGGGGGGGGGSTYIRSIQRVLITLVGVDTITATISAVETANTVILFRGCTSADASYTNGLLNVTLTNATTLTVNCSGTATNGIMRVDVIEFQPTAVVIGAQYGSINLESATSATASIAVVNTSYAAIFPLGFIGNVGSVLSAQDVCNIELTNSTTVTASAKSSSNITAVNFCVIEFAHAMIQSIQHRTVTVTGDTNTTNNDTISAVVVNNTMLSFSGFMSYSAATGASAIESYAALTSTTNVAFKRVTGTSSDRVYKYDVIEFASGVLNSAVQRGTITLNNVVSNDVSISTVDINKAATRFCGFNTAETSSGQALKQLSRVSLQTADTVRGGLNSANANPSIVSYEIVEFT